MPQCPFCNAAVWIGQRYCATCDNYLPHPEEKDNFCPQCGIRVASQQEICHKCKAPLPKIAGPPSRALARARRLPPRVLSIFIGTGLVIVALLLVFLFKKSPRPPKAASEQTPAVTLVPPAETAPSAPTAPAAQKPAVQSAPASPSPPDVTTPPPSPPVYFVNVPGLALRDGPTMSAPQISILYFKDEVELLDTSGAWGKVRDMRRNIVGWCALRFLQPVSGDGPRAAPQQGSLSPQGPVSCMINSYSADAPSLSEPEITPADGASLLPAECFGYVGHPVDQRMASYPQGGVIETPRPE